MYSKEHSDRDKVSCDGRGGEFPLAKLVDVVCQNLKRDLVRIGRAVILIPAGKLLEVGRVGVHRVSGESAFGLQIVQKRHQMQRNRISGRRVAGSGSGCFANGHRPLSERILTVYLLLKSALRLARLQQETQPPPGVTMMPVLTPGRCSSGALPARWHLPMNQCLIPIFWRD